MLITHFFVTINWIFLGLMVLSIFTFEKTNTSYIRIVGETLDFVSLIISFILFHACFKGIRIDERISRDQFFFILLLNVNAIGSFCDYFSCKVYRIPEYANVNICFRTLYCFIGPFCIYIFWCYLVSCISIKNQSIHQIISFVQNALIITSGCIVLSNVFTNYYFTVDSRGIFHRTESFSVVNTSLIVVLICLNVVTLINSDVSIRKRFILGIYSVLPISTMFIHLYFDGISITFTAFSIMTMFLYIDIQAKKNLDLLEMRLKILHSEVQPHFLYNGLASLRGLIQKSPDDAVDLLNHFMNYMRELIHLYDMEGLVPIEKELAFIQDYLEIESIRFGGSIRYEIEQCPISVMIPPISIQPYVENAIRHGIRKKEDGQGCVWIRFQLTEKELTIFVVDDGIGFDEEQVLTDGQIHVGLDNTRKRFQWMVNGNVEIRSKRGVGTEVAIHIPRTD